MLAPDDLTELHEFGDQTVSVIPDDDQPGLPPSTERPRPWFNDPKQARKFEPIGTETIGAGGTEVYGVDWQPDFWLVTVPVAASTDVEVHYGTGRNRAPVAALQGGGYCRIPGRGQALTIVNNGAGDVTPIVVAASGWGEMSTGDILIVPGNTA